MLQENPLHFDGSWRSYQLRILDNLEFHLRDKKLHVVAAPGAGKTTLGIEVISLFLNTDVIVLKQTGRRYFQTAMGEIHRGMRDRLYQKS